VQSQSQHYILYPSSTSNRRRSVTLVLCELSEEYTQSKEHMHSQSRHHFYESSTSIRRRSITLVLCELSEEYMQSKEHMHSQSRHHSYKKLHQHQTAVGHFSVV